MQIVAIILIGLALAYFLTRMGPRNRQGEDMPNGGMHNRRIGDGLRHLTAIKEKYAVMTESLLDQTPDDELIEAVLANLWAKMDDDLSNAVEVLSQLSTQRRNLYALYSVTGDVKREGFVKTMQGADAPFMAAAGDALYAMDMQQSVALLKAAAAAPDADSYQTPYIESFTAEDGKTRMVEYIRANPRGFVDLS